MAVDLFSLTARLVLDSSEYTSALSSAETSASNANVDVDGEASLDTSSLETDISSAETSASGADVDVEGDATLDTSDFESGVDTVESDSTSLSSSVTSLFGDIAESLTAAGITLVLKQIGDLMATAITDAANYADTVDKGARALSMSTESYQVWQHALKASGADISGVSRGWLSLTNAMETAKSDQEAWAEDTSDVKKALDALGIDPTKFSSAEAMFDAIMTDLSQIGAGSTRDSLVTAIFGRGGTQLNALLDEGAEGIRELKQEAYDLGLVMSGEDIEKGVALGDSLANMQEAVDALKQSISIGLVGPLTEAVNTITDIIAFFNGRTSETTLQEQFEGIDEAMNDAFDSAAYGEKKSEALIDKLIAMSDETGKCSGNLDVWKGIANELIKICPDLADQIDLETGSIKGQKDELLKLSQAWFDSARAQAVAQSLQDKQAAIVAKQNELTEKQIEAELADTEASTQRAAAEQALLAAVQDRKIEGYTAEDIAAMSDWELANSLYGIQNRYNIFESGNETYTNAVKAREDFAKALNEKSRLETEVADLETQLQTAADEYEQYAQAANSVLEGLEQNLTGSTTEATKGVNDLNTAIDDLPKSKTVTIRTLYESDGASPIVVPHPHAFGLNYVPYDGYMAELHRGEAVLNSAQASNYRQGGGGANGQELYSVVAEAVAAAVSNIRINMDGKEVGHAVAQQVSRDIYSEQRARRYE